MAAISAGVVNTIQPLIIGGQDADLGQFPWQAFIYIDNSALCSASLVMPQWILTAAHCTVK
jgi:secreted trypsin-like serine protease